MLVSFVSDSTGLGLTDINYNIIKHYYLHFWKTLIVTVNHTTFCLSLHILLIIIFQPSTSNVYT